MVVTPQQMEKKMAFVNADDMKQALRDSGKVALYGLCFDTDKDAVKAESKPTLAEIAKLLKSDTSLGPTSFFLVRSNRSVEAAPECV